MTVERRTKLMINAKNILNKFYLYIYVYNNILIEGPGDRDIIELEKRKQWSTITVVAALSPYHFPNL